jgi:hypothetical protein
MKNQTIILSITALLVFILALNLASAIVVDDISQDKLYPGASANINIILDNNLNDDAEDVSFSLNFDSTTASPNFVPVGSADYDTDEIKEDKSREFTITIKAANSIEPGIYNIPYTLSYKIGSNNTPVTKTGTIGLTVSSKVSLDFSVLTETPVIGEQGKVTLKIVNKGFGQIKFVSVSVQPQGYTLLSEDKVYIGSISSDDFETAAFDVIFNKQSSRLIATVTYKDLENNDMVNNVDIAIPVYTREKALELGIIQANNTWIYVLVAAILLVVWLIWRAIKKKRRLARSMNGNGENRIR